MTAARQFGCCLVIISAAALSACSSGADASPSNQYAHLIAFDTARVRVVSRSDTAVLTLELAESPEQQTMGLMERQTLAPDAGMLFLYPGVQPESSAFWMFRTRIPLDIAFIDSTGVIRTVQTMEPCRSLLAEGCPSYPAGTAYRAALEVNAGYFARRQIHVGDRVLLQDTLTRTRATQRRLQQPSY